METEKGWKVVRPFLDADRMRYMSASFPDVGIRALYRVEYVVDKWAIPLPGCGPLAVFSDQEMAEKFAWGNKSLMIFPCEYEPSLRLNMWTVSDPAAWLAMCPLTTRFARRVKLLQRKYYDHKQNRMESTTEVGKQKRPAIHQHVGGLWD